MAPEFSDPKYGKEVDVFSLGMSLLEVFAGSLPYKTNCTSKARRILARQNMDYTDFPETLGSLRAIIMNMLHFNPK